MSYVQPTAPNIDGLCSFISNDTICMAVQTKLNDIRSSFVQDANNAEVNTFWITAKYNSTVAGTSIDASNNYPVINGDTAEHCLALFDNPTQGM